MGVRRGYRSVVVSGVLCAVALLVGCAAESSGWQYQSGFSSLPETCADAVRPAESAVRGYAGELYDATSDFDRADRSDGGDFSDLYCAVKYSDPILREPVEPRRVAMARDYSISMSLNRLPRFAGMTTSRLAAEATTTDNDSPPRSLPGIGDDAIVWVREVDQRIARVGVRFRIGNLRVEVETSGRDWSGVPQTFPVGNSSALREDLRAGAESIAAAIARQARSAFPTTVYNYESPTSATSPAVPTTSTTATPSAAPVWDPCATPASDLAAAGVRIQPERSGCSWRGTWFAVHAAAVATDYETTLFSLGYQQYARPTPLTVGGRSAVMLHWESSEHFCVLAFDVAADPRAGGKPRVLLLEASMNEENKREALCSELVRVGTAVVGSLPPAA